MIKLEAKNWTVQGDLMVAFFRSGPIPDEVWQDYCDTIASPTCHKVMATSIGAVEVSSAQRKLVSDVLKQCGAAVAVVTDLDEPARPCGACRQVLAEFGLGMQVVMVGRGGVRRQAPLRELLPDPFTFGDVERGRQ